VKIIISTHRLVFFGLCAIGLLVGAWSLYHFFFCTEKKLVPGTIVILNGTSSAGKTSILQELQKIYDDPCIVNLDSFYKEYKATHPRPKSMTKDERDAYNNQMLDVMYVHTAEIASKGQNVFVDTVQFDDNYQHFCSLLDRKNTIKIAVYCPLDVIAAHVEKRTKEGDPRDLHLPVGQFSNMYKVQESPHEPVVDTIATSRIKPVLQLAKDARRQRGKEMLAQKKITQKEFDEGVAEVDQLTETFAKQWKLDERAEITIVTKNPWDLVVNSGVHSPAELAHQIAAYVEKRVPDFKKRAKCTDVVAGKKRASCTVDSKLYDRYVGNYRLKEDFILAITKENNQLFLQATGQKKYDLTSESETTFFNRIEQFAIAFVKDKRGDFSQLILHQGGKDTPAEKMG
jgi:adenylylsulfate kinase-like enzyme